MVNAEVSTLLDLLDSAGVGDEIRSRYQPLREPDELSPEERTSLPKRALKYIEKLEAEFRELEALNDQTETGVVVINGVEANDYFYIAFSPNICIIAI